MSRKRVQFFLVIFAGFTLLAVVAQLVSRSFGTDLRLTSLVGMLAAYAISGKPDPQSIIGYDHP